MKKVRLYLLLPVLLLLGTGISLQAQCENTHIQIAGGGEVANTCPGDSNDDLVDVENNGTGINEYAYIATDQNNAILEVNLTNTFNFEDAGVGTCFVWGINYTGAITAEAGDDLFSVPLSDGCYRLSVNRLTINRTNPDGGTIQNLFGSSNTASFCTTDPYADFLAFQKSTTSNSPYTYLITDADNNIITNTDYGNFDFSGVAPGVCRIWGLSYQGNLTLTVGDDAAASNLSDDCFDLSDNFIEVTRYDVDGGTVADGNGDTALSICAGDAMDDVVTFTHQNNSSSSYSYIVTDENNIVLGLPLGDNLDFNGAGEGVCRVWGLSYVGDRTLYVGDNIMNKSLATDCYDLSENFIEVVRTGVDGGEVYTTDSESMVYTCPGDGVVDIIAFMHSNNSNASFTYVVTDIDGNILGIPPANTQNFEDAGAGTCLVWGLSYTGNLLAQMGDNALEINLSDGCFDLSDNFITVERDTPDGGTVSTVDGADMVYTCPENGINDIIEFASSGASNSNFTYVVTDDSNNILGLPSENSQNFEGAGSGVCRVWGLAYTGEVIANIGDNVAFTTLTTGCSDLSDNFITVVREQPAAGTLDYNGGPVAYTCPGDNVDDILEFTATDFNQNFQLVITDENYNILGLPSGNSQNFEGAGLGTCLAWGVAYSGNVLAAMGDNIYSTQFASDCWSFSDPVRVVRDTPDGGTIQNNSGNNEVTVCTTDGNADVISYSHTSSSSSAYSYVITDGENNILVMTTDTDFNFEGVPPGVCRIWGLSYSGILSDAIGDNATTATLSTGCFELSSNFIEVTRTDVDGATVAMPSGATVRYTCANDGNADVVMFTNASTSPSNYIYVITDNDNTVLGLPAGDSADLEGAGVGICRVWGLSYTGDLTLYEGDNIMNKSLSTDCYDLSENYITVNRDQPYGGTVSMPSGATERYTCTGDGNPDVVMFTKQDFSNSNYAYIITSPTLEILGIEMNDFHDFDGAPAGTCWVWGLAYTGSITAQVGDQADEVALTDDCFDLSDNFISIIRDSPFGGTVETVDGETSVSVIVGDGVDDIIEFSNSGNPNSNFAYVITDDQNNILGLPMGNSQNFEGAGTGVCRVWGLSYTGNIIAGIDDNATMVALTDDCYNLSTNFIEVTRTESLLDNGAANSFIGNSNNNTFTEFKITPNPARDFVTVNFGKNISVSPTVHLQILNVQGQVIYSRVFDVENMSNNTVVLDIQSYTAGVYFMNVQTATETNTERFVKQ